MSEVRPVLATHTRAEQMNLLDDTQMNVALVVVHGRPPNINALCLHQQGRFWLSAAVTLTICSATHLFGHSAQTPLIDPFGV